MLKKRKVVRRACPEQSARRGESRMLPRAEGSGAEGTCPEPAERAAERSPVEVRIVRSKLVPPALFTLSEAEGSKAEGPAPSGAEGSRAERAADAARSSG